MKVVKKLFMRSIELESMLFNADILDRRLSLSDLPTLKLEIFVMWTSVSI